MGGTSPPDVTRLLLAWSDGDDTALQRLMSVVYVELRRLAERYMGRERAGHTLQTTALINEAYLRLVGARGVQWQNRAHFYAVSAGAMHEGTCPESSTSMCRPTASDSSSFGFPPTPAGDRSRSSRTGRPA